MSRSFPPASLHGCGVVDLAHEEDAPSGVLQDEDKEGSVKFHDFGHSHGHYLDGGAARCRCSSFIYIQHGPVGHLWRNPEEITFRDCTISPQRRPSSTQPLFNYTEKHCDFRWQACVLQLKAT